MIEAEVRQQETRKSVGQALKQSIQISRRAEPDSDKHYGSGKKTAMYGIARPFHAASFSVMGKDHFLEILKAAALAIPRGLSLPAV